MPRMEIISHPLCPHAHRLVLIATAKGWRAGTDYQLTYLPYATLRETVPKHSPTGELPVLKIDGVLRTSNSGSAAEYLDGVTELGLIPAEPDLRLKVRERERRVGAMLDTMRMMFAGQSADGVRLAIDQVFEHLVAFDSDLTADGTTEETMRMDMAALEPAFTLLLFFPALAQNPHWNRLPRLRDIAQRAVRNPWLIASQCPNYKFEFDEFFKMTNSSFPAVMHLHQS